MKKVRVKVILFLTMLVATVGIGGITVNATIEHPHPSYKDTWDYGTYDNYGWSHYYLEAPVRLGSASSVKNIFGTVKNRQSANYGWARSDANKSWNDVRLDAFYGWYSF